MRIYSPHELTQEESLRWVEEWADQVEQMRVNDETLRDYVATYLAVYRSTLEEFFPDLAPLIDFYSRYPFRSLVLRLGPNGVIFAHRPSSSSSIEVLRPTDLDPPLETANVLQLQKRWQTPFMYFDFRIREYSTQEAIVEAQEKALDDAFGRFWEVVSPPSFSRLCVELLQLEGIQLETEVTEGQSTRFDAKGQVMLPEPAGFRRMEEWSFEFKRYQDRRVSVQYLRQIEEYLRGAEEEIDVLCLITNGDLTSVGSRVAVKDPRIRVWDRAIVRQLVGDHLEILEPLFSEYKQGVEATTQKAQQQGVDQPQVASGPSRLLEFQTRLEACPPGRKHFTRYEEIGTDILLYLFPHKLGDPKPQQGTIDGKQRRDVLFRNHRSGRFFQRIADKFEADFLITDFKNYTDPIGSDVVNDVTKYANEAIGRFILVVSRKGPEQGIETIQARVYRDWGVMVLAVSDEHMLEMVKRKEKGENPEDVLEDLLDNVLMGY
jgi:hypothetical protein